MQGAQDRSTPAGGMADLSPSRWPSEEYRHFVAAQGATRSQADCATGRHGGVAVSYNAFAARAGLEALKQGGSAVDAALTAAMTQIALSAGAPISYFGIMSLVYYEASTGRTHTMNAEWNTLLGETDPLSIPGGLDFSSPDGFKGRDPSGRTALVGGFMKGVEAAHRRFGKLPFARLFDPAIELAEEGMPVTPRMGFIFNFRPDDLARLPETRATFLKPDGKPYAEGDVFRQPRLAETLRRVAAEGADYMHGGPWGRRAVEAVQADGGRMTLEDLTRYEVIWADPLTAPIGPGWQVQTNPWPNSGGVALIEAQNLAVASGLASGPHWTRSAEALRTAHEITQQFVASYLSPDLLAQLYPGLDLSPAARVTPAHAEALWARMRQGARPARFKPRSTNHSDDVVAVDSAGNIAAITHSINCVVWGKTAIVVDGITIGDPAAFQQSLIAHVGPGARLPAPTQTGLLLKDGKPVLGFASMNEGLHHRTFQCLLNYTRFGMSLEDAVNAPDFFMPWTDPATGELVLRVPAGRFDPAVLDGTGLAWREHAADERALVGQGDWIAVARDPASGLIEACSHNRGNSGAVAF